MGLFKRKPSPAASAVIDGSHELCVVGESYYQDAILAITGPKSHDAFFVPVLATLQREPSNPYDANAVAVYVGDRKVGHLPRETAADVSPRLARRRTPCVVNAHINGGWKRSAADEGFCGVVLQMPDLDQL